MMEENGVLYKKFDMLVEMDNFCISKNECEDEMMAKLMRQF
jgi:hypothetical protein